MKDKDSIITLCDDDGKEYKFVLLGFTEYEAKLYAVFMPEECDDEDEEQEIPLIVMEAFEEKGETSFELMEDETIGNAVLEKFMSEQEEEEN